MTRALRSQERPPGTVRRGMALPIVLLIPIAVMFWGITADGGNNNVYREEARDTATQAARAGADEIDLDYLRTTGIVRLDPAAAETAAAAWIAATGHTGTVAATVDSVTATVTIDQPLSLLALTGRESVDVTVAAAAAPRTGVTEPGDLGGT
ncbi:hypothetical protein [Glycomyces sp. MUSA5-2]|uniref:hypothetical protein n=1 Tax=Glycomyces sp. MUSA5-2 TaxID=2053002 RepID=UPI003008DF46